MLNKTKEQALNLSLWNAYRIKKIGNNSLSLYGALMNKEQNIKFFMNKQSIDIGGIKCFIAQLYHTTDSVKMYIIDYNGRNVRIFDIDTELQVWKEPNPLASYPVDTKLIVWSNEWPLVKHNRHFSHLDKNGLVWCFNDGATSFSSANPFLVKQWDNYEIVVS